MGVLCISPQQHQTAFREMREETCSLYFLFCPSFSCELHYLVPYKKYIFGRLSFSTF